MAMRRFEIAQDSMRPNLVPGTEVIAVDGRRPDVGDVVVFRHPNREDFWVVKRVVEPPVPIGEDEVWVVADDLQGTRSDSRTLGALPITEMWTVVSRLDSGTFTQACRLLAQEDHALASVLDQHGPPEFWERSAGFPTLVWLILEQQVSLESGAAMYRRLHDAAGSVTPEAMMELGAARMREIGVTRQKAVYLTELAEAVHRGDLPLDQLDDVSASEARSLLLEIKGIGPWTADAYLLSALRHPDIFPVGDRALQVGTGEVLGMATAPDPEELELLSAPWRPIRAAAARIIWHGYLAARGRVEPSDPTQTHDAARRA